MHLRRSLHLALSQLLIVNIFVNLHALGHVGTFTIDARLPAPAAEGAEIVSTAKKLMKVGRFDRAREVLTHSSHFSKDDSVFTRTLVCYFLSGEYDELIKVSDKWLHDNTQSSRKKTTSLVYEFVGISYFQKGDMKSALTAFSSAIKADPTPYAYAGRAKVYQQMKEAKLAADDLYYAIVSGLETPWLGQILEVSLGQQNGIVPATEQPIAAGNKQWKSLVTEAEALESKGKFENAMQLYKKAAEKWPAEPILWEALGLSAMTTAEANDSLTISNRDTSESAFEKALNLKKKDWKILNNLAILKFQRNKIDLAKDDFKTVFQDSDVPVHQKWRIDHAIRVCETIDRLNNRH